MGSGRRAATGARGCGWVPAVPERPGPPGIRTRRCPGLEEGRRGQGGRSQTSPASPGNGERTDLLNKQLKLELQGALTEAGEAPLGWPALLRFPFVGYFGGVCGSQS